jgi:hypothetical protein
MCKIFPGASFKGHIFSLNLSFRGNKVVLGDIFDWCDFLAPLNSVLLLVVRDILANAVIACIPSIASVSFVLTFSLLLARFAIVGIRAMVALLLFPSFLQIREY